MENQNNNPNENQRNLGGEIDSLKNDLADIKSEIKTMISAMFTMSEENKAKKKSDEELNAVKKAMEQREADRRYEAERREAERRRNSEEREAERREAMRHRDEERQRRNRNYDIPEQKKPRTVFLNGVGSNMNMGLDLNNLGMKIRQTVDDSLRDLNVNLKDLSKDFSSMGSKFKEAAESFKGDGNELFNRVLNKVEKNGEEMAWGMVTYGGGYLPRGKGGTMWYEKECSISEILNSIQSSDTEKALAGIGSKQKLDIIMALIRKPMTVNELVSHLGFNTTGQAYHHLNYLLAADIVVVDNDDKYVKGLYTINSGRVGGIIMVLAGIRDLMAGNSNWDFQEEFYPDEESPDGGNGERPDADCTTEKDDPRAN